jgi:hypothetical protein
MFIFQAQHIIRSNSTCQNNWHMSLPSLIQTYSLPDLQWHKPGRQATLRLDCLSLNFPVWQSPTSGPAHLECQRARMLTDLWMHWSTADLLNCVAGHRWRYRLPVERKWTYRSRRMPAGLSGSTKQMKQEWTVAGGKSRRTGIWLCGFELQLMSYHQPS